ncbi:MAG: hypothetical protein EPN48_16310 [Microbacteriaceae bacterium]|nr:MAG: hypothetical protein EPN48_16310 [Microbacteriaceae bacterium]
MKIKRAGEPDRVARLQRAEQFAAAAELLEGDSDYAEVYVTLCVLSGIASSDVICLRNLGYYVQGDDHTQAVKALAQVNRKLSVQLDALLSMKTLAGYSTLAVSHEKRTRAGRAMDALLEIAQATRAMRN